MAKEASEIHITVGREMTDEEGLLGERLAQKVGGMVEDLILGHYAEIAETWAKAEEGKMKLAASVTLEGSPRKSLVAVKLSWSQKFEAETEGVLDDPNQGQLPIGDGLN